MASARNGSPQTRSICANRVRYWLAGCGALAEAREGAGKRFLGGFHVQVKGGPLRKLGIVGGMSWSSTALYYEHLNRGVAQRLGGLHSARLVIESVDFARIAEMELAGDWDGIAGVTRDAAKRLEKSGAEGIVIACNTVHKCYDAVRASVRVPVLHIGDAVADRLAADRRSRVALLGTRLTMTEPHVRSRLEARGIALAPIAIERIREVDRIIFDELAAGRVVRDSQRKLKTLITELAKQRVEAIVLGCTELVLAVDVRANVLPVYDTTAIHARAAVDWMLADQEPARAAA
jgi:aspartate racemase